APTPPHARKRPGKAVPLLAPALGARGPRDGPHTPHARKRPGKAVPLLGPALRARGARDRPHVPHARPRPGPAVPPLGPARRGLAASLDPAALSIVVNTGDDAEVWGLHVSPDLDSVMYALAGVLDAGRGWGRADETFRCLSAMAAYGAPTWFGLGDRDLATHLVRTRALRAGQSLSAVTAELARALGVAPRLLPMSDQAVRTTIRTPDGRLGFQEYFVRDKCQAEVVGIDYDGADRARPAPGV